MRDAQWQLTVPGVPLCHSRNHLQPPQLVQRRKVIVTCRLQALDSYAGTVADHAH